MEHFISPAVPPLQREMTEVRCRKLDEQDEQDEVASEVHQQKCEEDERVKGDQMKVS